MNGTAAIRVFIGLAHALPNEHAQAPATLVRRPDATADVAAPSCSSPCRRGARDLAPCCSPTTSNSSTLFAPRRRLRSGTITVTCSPPRRVKDVAVASIRPFTATATGRRRGASPLDPPGDLGGHEARGGIDAAQGPTSSRRTRARPAGRRRGPSPSAPSARGGARSRTGPAPRRPRPSARSAGAGSARAGARSSAAGTRMTAPSRSGIGHAVAVAARVRRPSGRRRASPAARRARRRSSASRRSCAPSARTRDHVAGRAAARTAARARCPPRCAG